MDRQLTFEDWEFTRAIRIQQAGLGSITNERLADIQMSQARQFNQQRGHYGKGLGRKGKRTERKRNGEAG